MQKQIIFSGVATALITPFRFGAVDYGALEAIVEGQISGGVSALVFGGTTGEAATLSDTERYRLYEWARKKTEGRVKLILGTGTNDTAVALRHTRAAARIGCDGALVVTPYYNKGTEAGIIGHYLRIAEASEVPIILYNVPSRTGVNLSLKALGALAEHPNIVGIKEASDSAERICNVAALGDSLHLYAGNDSQIFSTLALGGRGVISVISNLVPGLCASLCGRFFAGDTDGARELQLSLLPLIGAMFCECNPAPIKYAMSLSGACENSLRLPLSPVSEKSEQIIKNALKTLPVT